MQEGGIVIRIRETEVQAKLVVNACGLYAPAVAHSIEGLPNYLIPRAYFVKGQLFRLRRGAVPFKHLVYPMPEAAGIGIHATLDLGGAVRFGPDRRMDRERQLCRRRKARTAVREGDQAALARPAGQCADAFLFGVSGPRLQRQISPRPIS